MLEVIHTSYRCATCGKEYPAAVTVCPTCRTILVTPGSGVRRRSYGWLVILLVVIILLLLAYAGYLGWQQLVLRDY